MINNNKMDHNQSSTYPHPPPYTIHPQNHQQQSTMMMPPVINQQPVHIVHVQSVPQVGPNPSMLICPSCKHNVMTRLEYESTIRTHLVAAALCLLGCWPCVCVPYCIDSCQNANHYCPSCGSFIGTYQSC